MNRLIVLLTTGFFATACFAPVAYAQDADAASTAASKSAAETTPEGKSEGNASMTEQTAAKKSHSHHAMAHKHRHKKTKKKSEDAAGSDTATGNME